MSQQGTMLSTIICLLPLFSHLQPVKGETTGELLESIGKQTQKENYNEIVCTFNVKVSLSRVDFVDKKGSAVFAIVDCGTSCNVLSSYQDVLRIVSPEKAISGDRFVFNASHSDKTTGTYTCHGITAPEVVYTPPSGTGDVDADGDESQMTSAPSPQTDEVSHNAGGGSNGLLALIIIPILLVLIGVVLFLHWWGVIRIPRLPKTRREPRDLRRIVGNLLQPVTGCLERTRALCQSTRADNEDSFKRRESNRDQDEEASLKDKELIAQKEDNQFLHLDAAPETFKSDLPYLVKESLDDEGNDNEVSVVEEEQPLLQDLYNNTKLTQDENTSVEESQISPQSVHLPSSIKATDVTAAFSSGDSIQHKEESPQSNIHAYAPHATGGESLKLSGPSVPPKPRKPSTSSSQTALLGNRDVTSDGDHGVSLQHTPLTSGTRVETEGGKNESMNGQLQIARNTEIMERTEKREGERAWFDMKEEESSEAKSETFNNEDMKGQLTTDKNKEDSGVKKERDNDRKEVEMKEKEILEIKSGTENKGNAKGDEKMMAEKAKQEDKEEAKGEVENAQELEAEAVREETADTRTETMQTSEEKKKGCNEDDETTFDDDDDRSRNTVAVDKLDGASSTGENLVYTDQSLPEDSQERSEDVKKLREHIKNLKPINKKR